jgi:hypothetical protein
VEQVKTSLLQNGINPNDMHYFIHTGSISNSGYVLENSRIKILMKSGEIKDIADASDLPTIKALGKIVKKHYLCWVNNVYLHS